MGQATPANKEIFRYKSQRSVLTDMDLCMRVPVRGNREKEAGCGAFPLHFITDFQPHSFRESPYK